MPVDAVDSLIRGVIAEVKTDTIEKSVSFFKQLIEGGKGDLVQAHYSDFFKRAKEVNPSISQELLMEVYNANKSDTKYLND